jgi:hypothetical protein
MIDNVDAAKRDQTPRPVVTLIEYPGDPADED